MLVLRPGDAQETAWAWSAALKNTRGPTALILTRQNLEVYPKADADWRKTAEKGAYIVKDTEGKPDVVVIATGSEVSLAVKAAEAVKNKKVRVVSMLSRERFLSQDAGFQESIAPRGVRTIVAEVGVSFGWEGFVQSPKDLFTIDSFGLSGPGEKVAAALGRDQASLEKLIAR
jgi:transketolase